jgi:hypothetical protein
MRKHHVDGCQHDFPPVEYQENSRIVRKDYSCRKCGAKPGPEYFYQQRQKMGVPMTTETRDQIISEMEGEESADPMNARSAEVSPATATASSSDPELDSPGLKAALEGMKAGSRIDPMAFEDHSEPCCSFELREDGPICCPCSCHRGEIIPAPDLGRDDYEAERAYEKWADRHQRGD